MTAITHPVAATHHVVGVLATAGISAGLAVGLTLAASTTNSAAPTTHLGRADATLCSRIAKATPGSAAMFRLADQLDSRGLCKREVVPRPHVR
jgi:hypothetical protein